MEARLFEITGQLHDIAEYLTPYKFDYFNTHLKVFSDELGLPLDQLRYVIALLLAYPLTIGFLISSKPLLRHFYSIVVGILMAQFVLGSGWVHSFFTSFVTYFLVKYFPSKYAPMVVFVFNMSYICLSHIYREYVDYMGWTLDFTGPQMLLVIKLTSFAYNYYDGVVDAERLESTPNSKALVRVYESRKRFAIHQLPSLVEYFGYVYCFTTLLAGPAFEIREYLEVVDGQKFKYHGKIQSKPSSVFPAIQRLVVGIFFMGLYQVLAPMFPLSNLYNDENAARPILQRIGYIWMGLLICRFKYYFAWKVAEGATILCGFGFEGFDEYGKPKGWGGVSNMDILEFEFAQSVREGSRSWNKGTQSWLERYVYSRNSNSLVITYFCSAFWHGFYPGYYLFFMSVPLATAVNRLAFKRLRPWFLTSTGSSGFLKKIYDVFCVLSTTLAMNYLVMPFQSLSWEYSLKALQHVSFSGHFILIGLYLVYSMIPIRKIHSKQA